MKKIYKTYPIKQKACEDQVKLFQKHYPHGIHVCKDCFQDAQDQGLHVWWLSKLTDWTWGERLQFYDRHTSGCAYLYPYYIRAVTKQGLAILEEALLEVDPCSVRKKN